MALKMEDKINLLIKIFNSKEERFIEKHNQKTISDLYEIKQQLAKYLNYKFCWDLNSSSFDNFFKTMENFRTLSEKKIKDVEKLKEILEENKNNLNSEYYSLKEEDRSSYIKEFLDHTQGTLLKDGDSIIIKIPVPEFTLQDSWNNCSILYKKLEINIKISNNNFILTVLQKDKDLKLYTNFYHPHIDTHGKLCLGQMEKIYYYCKDSFSLYLLYDSVCALLRTYNKESPYQTITELLYKRCYSCDKLIRIGEESHQCGVCNNDVCGECVTEVELVSNNTVKCCEHHITKGDIFKCSLCGKYENRSHKHINPLSIEEFICYPCFVNENEKLLKQKQEEEEKKRVEKLAIASGSSNFKFVLSFNANGRYEMKAIEK